MDILLTDFSLNLIIYSILGFQLLATLVLWGNRHVEPDSKAIFTIFIWIFPVLGALYILLYLLQKKILRKNAVFVRK